MSTTPQTISPTQIETADDSIIEHRLELHTYKITGEKIESLRKAAASGTTELALAIFFLSIGINFLVNLLTTKIDSTTIRTSFIALCPVGFVLGIYFGCKWYGMKSSVSEILDGILETPEKGRKCIK